MTLLFLIVESQGNTEGFKMPRKPRKLLKMRPKSISPALLKYFKGESYGPGDEGAVDVFLMELRPEMKKAWESYREQIIADWIRQNPCSRPWAWWEFDAPEPRRRIGGIGTPDFECLAYKPHYERGIPSGWITQDDFDTFGPDLKGIPFDRRDPPTFESETAYLNRLNFLTPAEKVHLRKHPELMEPEKIEFEEDDEE